MTFATLGLHKKKVKTKQKKEQTSEQYFPGGSLNWGGPSADENNKVQNEGFKVLVFKGARACWIPGELTIL